MAQFKVLKDCNNKKDGAEFKANTTVDKSIKYINDFESRLDKAGFDLPFFERLEEKK